MRQGLGAGALAAISAGTLAAVTAAIVSCAAAASPRVTDRAALDAVAGRSSLLHKVLIYAKEDSRKLIDGRWNLGQSKAKLGITFSSEETQQLMACTGRIVCEKHDGAEFFGSASSVMRPDLLVTAKHVFSKGRGGTVSYRWCSFRSFLHRNSPIPIRVEQDQRKGYFLNNEDFIVARLTRPLKDCNAFAISSSDSALPEGEEIFSATSHQRNTLNRVSRREPVLAKGTVRSVSSGFAGGPPFYYADIDLDEGGSGGAVFALEDGRPALDERGRLVLRGILAAVGPRARNGQPYSEDRNYTIIIGLQEDFRDLVEGKARAPVVVEQAQCLEEAATPEITVISETVSSPPPEPLAPFLPEDACASDDGKASDNCTKLAKELQKLAEEIQTFAAKTPARERHQFKLRNDTNCPICFAYSRCNDYGCWDEVVRASAKSTLFAGVSKRAPEINNPQFCMSGGLLADWRPPLPPRRPGPPLPPKRPDLTLIGVVDTLNPTVDPETTFAAAKEKAARVGVWALTAEDIRGLSLEQISELRGY